MNEISFIDSLVDLGVSFFIWLKNSLRIDLHKTTFYDTLIVYKKGIKGDIMDITKDILGIVISLSAVLGIFSGIVNKLFANKLLPIEKKIDANEKETLENNMQQWRFECVTFASNLRKGIPYSIYEFQAIFVFADKYEQAVKKLDLTNNLFAEELLFIKKKYAELTEEKNS